MKISYVDRSPFGPELSVPNNTEYRARAGNLIELPCGIASLSKNAADFMVERWNRKWMNIEEKIYKNSLILQLSSSSCH